MSKKKKSLPAKTLIARNHLPTAIYIISLFILTILLYFKALPAPLVYDSQGKLDILSLNNFSLLGTRWTLTLSLFFDHLLWGKNYSVFRFENILLHATNASLIFILLKRLFAILIPFHHEKQSLHPVWIAFVGALLFALSPVAVYATVNIIQRSILLATCFSLLAILSHLKGLISEKKYFYYIAVAFYFLAIHSKEHAIMLPAVIFVLTLALKKPNKDLFKTLLLPSLLYILAAAEIFFTMKGYLARVYEPKSVLILQNAGATDTSQYYFLSIINQGWLFFRYLLLWIFPLPTLMSIDVVTAFPQTIISKQLICFILFCIYRFICLCFLAKSPRYKLLGLGLIFPWILFFTELSTARMHESFVLYRSYFWMSGLYIALPFFYSFLRKNQQTGLSFLFCLLFFWVSLDRIATFKTPLTLWQDAMDKIVINKDEPAPFNAYRAYSSVAGYLGKQGEYEKSIEYYQKAIELSPHHHNLYNSLGVTLILLKKYDQAIPFLQKAVALNPTSDLALYNLANAYLETNDLDNAIKTYKQCIDLDPDKERAHYYLARTYFKKSDFPSAVKHYKESVRIAPDQAGVYEQLGMSQANLGQFDAAVKSFNKALKLDPSLKASKEALNKLKTLK